MPIANEEARALVPPHALDGSGEPRRVGVEIEFIGLPIERAAAIVVDLFGGRVARESEYELRAVGTRLGEFKVELDSSPLKAIARERKRSKALGLVDRARERIFGAVADHITPNEIVTSPLPPERLPEIDRLAHALGRAGAEGADASVMYVMGVHLNPTAPSSDPLVLRDYIRAYTLLHEWLVVELDTAFSRRLMRFATAYPPAYARKVLDPHYAPRLPELIDDYLKHNPTRNRALDLLPLFAHLDWERVARAVDDERVKGRPTFHFRLPNSQVHDPKFRISDEWKLWLEVERLAEDPVRLAELSARARAQLRLPLPALRRKLRYVRARARKRRARG
jgi:hypothetical protein